MTERRANTTQARTHRHDQGKRQHHGEGCRKKGRQRERETEQAMSVLTFQKKLLHQTSQNQVCVCSVEWVHCQAF